MRHPALEADRATLRTLRATLRASTRHAVRAAVCCALATIGAAAQSAIRLDGVPERLEYPLPDGVNRILTATIDGEAASEVWAAVLEGSEPRAALARAGEGRWQLNLGAAELEPVLRGRRRGELRIFARMSGGEVVQSAAVRFSFGGLHPSAPTWFVELADGRVSGYAGGTARRWIPVEEAVEVVWYYGRGAPLARVEAVAGAQAMALAVAPRERAARLELTPELRAAWIEAGELKLREAERAQDVVLRARPVRLTFVGVEAPFALEQRTTADVPGSGGFLRVRIDDITAGQVLLEMWTADRECVVPRRSVRAGDRVSFQVGREDYVLRVDRLVNVLIGDDHAELAVQKLAVAERARIEALLDVLARSTLVFLRNDAEHDGAAAAAHLRQKWAADGPKIRSVEEFIGRVASRSSTTGRPYRVRLESGETLDAADWLREQARLYDARDPDRRR